MSKLPCVPRLPMAVCALAIGLLSACAGTGSRTSALPVTVSVVGPNAVSYWNEIATTTMNQPALATGTPEEQRPNTFVDQATVQVAVYDALMAIVGSHKPYAITPTAPAANASQEAAVAAATYGVLRRLFPSRGASYEAAYTNYLATLPEGAAKTAGLAVGAEVAAGIVALRANDGRSVALAPYVPGTAPGQFRGINPIGREGPSIKPFALTSISQFRVPPPPPLGSAGYATDFNEVKALGSATSGTRTAEQTEVARFNTEPPPVFASRNLRNFAMTNRSLADHARVLALLWVVLADGLNACFESKYYYQAWRPTSAINLADTDGNDATTTDAAWKPVVNTPNHPEYPAAHSCFSAATATVLSGFYGTRAVTFSFNSTVTGTTRQYTGVDALVAENEIARIAGGMHFRFAAAAGEGLGKSVANWVLTTHFQQR